jgi:hypothetical protein
MGLLALLEGVASPPRIPSLRHTHEHTSLNQGSSYSVREKPGEDLFQRFPTASHSVWGRDAQTGIAAAVVVLEWGNQSIVPLRRSLRGSLHGAPKAELLDLGSPFVSKPNVVAYDRHVVFAPDDPTGVARHRAPGLENTTWVDVVLVHELPEQLVGSVFAQADAFAYACNLGIGVHTVPSALALVDSLEHCFALIISKVSPLHTVPFVRLFHAKEGYQKTGLR